MSDQIGNVVVRIKNGVCQVEVGGVQMLGSPEVIFKGDTITIPDCDHFDDPKWTRYEVVARYVLIKLPISAVSSEAG